MNEKKDGAILAFKYIIKKIYDKNKYKYCH
jgi:hypothetical protein